MKAIAKCKQIQDVPKRKDEFERALRVIAEHRNSRSLNRYLEVGVIGGLRSPSIPLLG